MSVTVEQVEPGKPASSVIPVADVQIKGFGQETSSLLDPITWPESFIAIAMLLMVPGRTPRSSGLSCGVQRMAWAAGRGMRTMTVISKLADFSSAVAEMVACPGASAVTDATRGSVPTTAAIDGSLDVHTTPRSEIG
jgi:hypothetical protein